MMNRTIAGLMLLSSLGTVGGCSAEVPDTGRVDLVESDLIEHSFTASESTMAELGVVTWQVMMDPETDSVSMLGLDAAGGVREMLQVEGSAEHVVLFTGEGTMLLDREGQILEDTLRERERHMLGFAVADVQAQEAEYRGLYCAASFIATLGLAAGCGTGNLVACAGIPFMFCNSSRHCGNDVCS